MGRFQPVVEGRNRPKAACRHRRTQSLCDTAFMKLDTVLGDFFLTFGKDLHIEANHALLRLGDFAKNLYLIKAGAVRICVRDPEGSDISVQFFFEGEVVSSLETWLAGCPSELEIITMEACHLCVLDRDTVQAQILSKPILADSVAGTHAVATGRLHQALHQCHLANPYRTISGHALHSARSIGKNPHARACRLSRGDPSSLEPNSAKAESERRQSQHVNIYKIDNITPEKHDWPSPLLWPISGS